MMPIPDYQTLMLPLLKIAGDGNVDTEQDAEHRSLSLTRPLAFFDLETTGTIVGIDRIVELAVVKLWPDGKRSEHEWRFNPEMAIPEEASRIHGIRDEDVRDKPTFRDSLGEIREVFRDSDVAGFNIARFDMPMLQCELERAGVKTLSSRNIVDAMTIFHLNEKRDLSAAFRYFCDKEIENAHSALADVRATVEVLEAQLSRYADLPTTVTELAAVGNSGDSQYEDSGRWFVKRGGKLLFAKGKHCGKSVDEVARTTNGYLEWLKGLDDLPSDTAQCLQDVLREVTLMNLHKSDGSSGNDSDMNLGRTREGQA
jgi:DNA polymerase-3 subunit epsilon